MYATGGRGGGGSTFPYRGAHQQGEGGKGGKGGRGGKGGKGWRGGRGAGGARAGGNGGRGSRGGGGGQIVCASLDVPEALRGRIIGSGGGRVKQLQEPTGAWGRGWGNFGVGPGLG